ncbi:DUF5959 family protein, partial [Spirillospora sp. NPDC048819]|uniref:DUF5959 family protein n=1 Tax=Spirillospora sp. NPDC048819 TaxID=3155268 RepID=UPI0033EF5D07
PARNSGSNERLSVSNDPTFSQVRSPRSQGKRSNSVVLRLTKPVPEGELTGEIEVRSYFVSGRKKTWVSPDDLTSWETVLDDLSRGDNTAWREGQRATEIWLELDDFDRVIVSVVDRMSSLVSVELTIEVADGWLENHYKRLNAIRKMQPG